MEIAPDGSEVHPLTRTARCSSAQFILRPGTVARAVHHRSVEEVWHVTQGAGELWLKEPRGERIAALHPGVTIAIAQGVHFQFRAGGDTPLCVFAVTSPPWPLEGPDEAIIVEGPWVPNVR